MALKKVSNSSKPKGKVARVTIEVKMLITAKHESGMHVFNHYYLKKPLTI